MVGDERRTNCDASVTNNVTDVRTLGENGRAGGCACSWSSHGEEAERPPRAGHMVRSALWHVSRINKGRY